MAIVVDPGSHSCRCGFATSLVATSFPCVVGRPRYGTGAMLGAVQREVWVGEELRNREAILVQKCPMRPGHDRSSSRAF